MPPAPERVGTWLSPAWPLLQHSMRRVALSEHELLVPGVQRIAPHHGEQRAGGQEGAKW
jgi:hypothetical protein